MNNELLKQFILEVLRTAVLAVIPVALAYLQVIDGSLAAVLIVLLKGLDRGLHESKVSTKAITRF